MKNIDVAHLFFYQGAYNYFDRGSMNVSYRCDTYYSYYTAIAKKITGKEGQDILLISDDNFSQTTAKHINELRRACPFGYNNIISVPQDYGKHYLEIETIVKRLADNIIKASGYKMTLKANREYFINCYETLLKLNEKVCDIEQDFIDRFTPLYNDINGPEKLAILKAKNKEKERKKQLKLKAELQILITDLDLSSLAYRAYSDKSFDDKELKQKIKQYINPSNDLSFIWFEGESVKTSQHITVNRNEVETLLKLWSKGKLKHGMTISYYTVLEVTSKYVKVGCHKIPTENLQALCNQMNGKIAA